MGRSGPKISSSIHSASVSGDTIRVGGILLVPLLKSSLAGLRGTIRQPRCSASSKIAAQAFVVALIDHCCVLVVIAQTCIHLPTDLVARLDDFFQLLFGNQQVVWCQADLAGI